MRIGDLRIPFTLQEQDMQGAWNHVLSIWGALANKVSDDDTHIAIVRAGEVDISSGQRLAYEERYFLITDVQKVKENECWLRLVLKETKFLT